MRGATPSGSSGPGFVAPGQPTLPLSSPVTPSDLTLTQLRDAIATRQLSATDATRHFLSRVDAANPRLNALLEVFHDRATEQARATDDHLAKRTSPGVLAGVPIVLKDNICLSWGKTTCASRILENYRSPYTATAAEKLINTGATILAKANLDEFAMGSSCELSAFGPTKNPWDTSRVPGGSSGGSAAAVAAGLAPGSLGSDTGGSIRMPAGLCNLVGFKPTYGRVSRYGLVAYASSLDQIGPFARTVGDAALLASVVCGPDSHDSTCAELSPEDFTSELEKPVPRLVLGVPAQARSTGNHPAVAAALENAIKVFRDQGAQIVDIDLPTLKHGIAAYYIIATAEASSNLARFDGVRYGRRASLGPSDTLLDLYSRSRAEGFGPEVQRRIMLGTHVLSSGYYDAYYSTALKVRRLIKNDYDRAFEGVAPRAGARTVPACHAILLPSSPGPAFKIGEKTADPLALYLEDFYTVGVNLAGLPAITLPGGFAREDGRDLPVGVQLTGPALQDAMLLRIARMLEQGADFSGRRPQD